MNNIQLAASRAVCCVLRGRNLDGALETAREEVPAGGRAAVQDLCYGTLRFYGRVGRVLELLLNKPLRDENIRCLLLVALYQLQYGKAAPYAVVDHAVRAARDLNVAAAGLVNGVLRNFLRQAESLLRQADEGDVGRYSYPQWWVDALREQYGAEAEAILLEGNRHPPMTLRVNRRCMMPAEYLALLQQHEIAARLVEPGAVLLERPVAVDKLPGFREGWVSVQDAGAQYAAGLLDAREGMRVLDACAAPGGKAAHVLECADVDLLALDKDEQRLQRVRENFARLHLTAQVQCGDAAVPLDWWDGVLFERILADVPCSASGVVRRHPDSKWLRRPHDIVSFSQQQAQILATLWRLLASDGKLLYVTCSVFARENEAVVAAFLREHEDSRKVLSPVGRLLPDEQHDGFYYAVLHKRG
jgi:16S rRNA (cytosine967-C5)-methyltransferase